MDHIEGLPAGYRLGRSIRREYEIDSHGGTPKEITFELIPIEQPKPVGICAQCGAIYSPRWIGTTCSKCDGTIEQPKQPTYAEHESEMMDRMMEVEDERHNPTQPKQLEAVIVVPISKGSQGSSDGSLTKSLDGITPALAEFIETMWRDRVTIREKGQ